MLWITLKKRISKNLPSSSSAAVDSGCLTAPQCFPAKYKTSIDHGQLHGSSLNVFYFLNKLKYILLALGLLIVGLVLSSQTFAAMSFDEIRFPVFQTTPNDAGGEDYSVSVQILLLMTSLTLLPALVLSMTAFTRILIVFSILRQAIGLQQTPSNQIIIGLTLFITFFVMTPVIERVNDNALQPYLNEEITSSVAMEQAIGPFRQFMLAQTREDDIVLFASMSGRSGSLDKDTLPMSILLPAFVTSELKTAFQIGFILFIPFLIIDLVVASVLMAMGMMMLSPLIVSLPFKIMLFVFVDGWALIIGSLATSFRGLT